VFPFSAREGTDAAALPDRVASRVAEERSRILRALSREKNLQFRRRFEGRVLPGLTLAAEEGMGESVVLTDNYIHAHPASADCACRRIGWCRSASTKSKGTRCGGRWSARLPASHEAVCDRLCGDARMCCAIEESVERVRAQ